MFYYNALGAFLKALIKRTDCCTEVLWLLVQTHHIIRCSHKRDKNHHFNQHMMFGYCEEGQGFFFAILGRGPRAFQVGKICAVNH